MAKNVYTFSKVPTINKPRSRFDLSHRVLATGNVGTLYPFDVQEVYPGDTFKERIACVARLTSTFVRPIMDNIFVDVAYFYCPSRLIDDNFEKIFGSGEPEEWTEPNTHSVPIAYGTVNEHTVADYLGVFPIKNSTPVGGVNTERVVSSDAPVSLYPFRAFAKIWNEWFRDENLEEPVFINKSTETFKTFNNDAWSASNYMGKLPRVNRFHDVFSSCLPQPQKGLGVSLSASAKLPVYSRVETHLPNVAGENPTSIRLKDMSTLHNVNSTHLIAATYATPSESLIGVRAAEDITTNTYNGASPMNLWAIGSDVSLPINELRFGLAFQRLLELNARGGTRYIEYCLSHFGVNNPDGRLQRTELLSYKRTPINVTQVTQTTGFNGGDGDTLGQVGAFSLTGARSYFDKGFTEHGYVIGVFCIRHFRTYQNGINELFFRFTRNDFYDPVYANIGEQPVYRRNIFYDITAPKAVFGYNEAWINLRYIPNRVVGQARSGVTNSLDVWHLADDYTSTPYLNEDWLYEDPSNLDSVISVSSSDQDQFILDFYVQHLAYRRLPTYSVPRII